MLTIISAGTIMISFTLNYSVVVTGGVPTKFHWPVFLLGLIDSS